MNGGLHKQRYKRYVSEENVKLLSTSSSSDEFVPQIALVPLNIRMGYVLNGINNIVSQIEKNEKKVDKVDKKEGDIINVKEYMDSFNAIYKEILDIYNSYRKHMNKSLNWDSSYKKLKKLKYEELVLEKYELSVEDYKILSEFIISKLIEMCDLVLLFPKMTNDFVTKIQADQFFLQDI